MVGNALKEIVYAFFCSASANFVKILSGQVENNGLKGLNSNKQHYVMPG